MPTPSLQDFQTALQQGTELPPGLVGQLAEVLAQVVSGQINNEEAQKVFRGLRPELPSSLEEKEIAMQGGTISFGSGNKFGDVRFRDIAGRDIVNITLNVMAPTPPEPVKEQTRRVFICYDPSDARSVQVFTALQQQLNQAGVQILTGALPPGGMQLPRSSYVWMGLAHSAVLLVTRQMLGVSWLETETRILTGRFILKNIQRDNILFVPVMLDPLLPEELEKLHLAFPNLNLTFIQAGAPQETADAVIKTLQPLKTMRLGETALETIARQIEKGIEKVSIKTLETTAEALELPLESTLSDSEVKLLVASALWNADITSWAVVTDKLGPELEDGIAGLMMTISPSWVHPCAARCLLDAARPGAARRAILINGEMGNFIGRSFVRRAFHLFPNQDVNKNWRIAVVNNMDVTPDPIQAIWTQVKKTILAQSDLTKEAAERQLRLMALRRQHAFIVIGPPAPDALLLRSILDAFPFSNLIFLLLTGAGPFPEEMLDALVLDPPLPDYEEIAAADYLTMFGQTED